MELNIGRILFPLTLLLICWLFFELIEFFRLGGAAQPLACTIVKISVITSTIIGLSTERVYVQSPAIENLIEKLKSLSIDAEYPLSPPH